MFEIIATGEERVKDLDIAKIFESKVINCTNRIITLRAVGADEKLVSMEEIIHQILHSIGVLEKLKLQRDYSAVVLLYTVDQDHIQYSIFNVKY